MDSGATLERGVEVAIGGDDVREVLQRIADRLPQAWRAGVSTFDGEPLLRADAGDFVAVEGRADGPGRVLLDRRDRLPAAGFRLPRADRRRRRRSRPRWRRRWAGGAARPARSRS